jgi:hypothetical protein
METKPKLFLSPSRIDKYNDCSWLYYCRYILKLPDTSNDGANRGSVVHDVLEPLLKPRHKKHFDKIIADDTIMKCAPVYKLVRKLAQKYNVDDSDNIVMINGFIMVALKHEFFGPEGTQEILGEKEFAIEVDNGDVRYNVRGFIDKTFVIKDKEGLKVSITDYKSSKQKYEGDKLANNSQNYIYQLALKHLYPNIARRAFKFLFLKFAKDPIQQPKALDENSLEGYEYYLTELQNKIENFTIRNGGDNFAAQNDEKRWLCGREGKKKDGSPNWICAMRRPFYYYAALDEKGEVIKTAFKEEDLDQKYTIEKRFYSGCNFFFNADGKPRNFN